MIKLSFIEGEAFEKNAKYTSKEEKLKHYENQKLQMIPEAFCAGLPSNKNSFSFKSLIFVL